MIQTDLFIHNDNFSRKTVTELDKIICKENIKRLKQLSYNLKFIGIGQFSQAREEEIKNDMVKSDFENFIIKPNNEEVY